MTEPPTTRDVNQSFSILSCSFDTHDLFSAVPWRNLPVSRHGAFTTVEHRERLVEPCSQTTCSPVLNIRGNCSCVRAKAAHILGHLPIISKRYEKGSIIITSNRPLSEWDKVFIDKKLAAAIVDRLMHHNRCHAEYCVTVCCEKVLKPV